MIAPAIRTEIMLRLAEAEHDVRILVAIESGRRASPNPIAITMCALSTPPELVLGGLFGRGWTM
jgi:hypothetical protein